MTFLLLWMQSIHLILVEVYVISVFIYLEMGAIYLFLYKTPILNSDLVWLLFRFFRGLFVLMIFKLIVGEVIEVIIEHSLTEKIRGWQLANDSQLKWDFLLWNVNFNGMECGASSS